MERKNYYFLHLLLTIPSKLKPSRPIFKVSNKQINHGGALYHIRNEEKNYSFGHCPNWRLTYLHIFSCPGHLHSDCTVTLWHCDTVTLWHCTDHCSKLRVFFKRMISAQQLEAPLLCRAILSPWQPLTKLYCLKCTNPCVTFGKSLTFSCKKSVFWWEIFSHCQSQGVIRQTWRTYMIDSFTQLWKIAQNLLFPSLANASKPLEMIWGPLDPATPSLRTSPSSLSLLW